MIIINTKKINFSITTFIILFFVHTCCFAQFEKSLDSISRLKTDIERTRGFVGSAEELKMSRLEYKKYMDAARKLGHKYNDKLLIEHLDFIEDSWKTSKGKRPEEQFDVLFERIAHYKKENKLLLAAYCHHFAAQEYFKKQEYGLSFENYFAANEIFEQKGYENVPIVSKFLQDFALSRYFFKDYDEVIQLMHKSLKLPPYNSNHDIQRYNNLGVAYASLGNKDSALFYFEKTRLLGKKYNSLAWEGITAGNIGDVYYKENNFPEALKHYSIQYQTLKNSPFDPNKISSYVNVAKTQLELGNYKDANKLIGMIENAYRNLRENISYGDDQQIETSKKGYYELKTNYLIKTNNLSEALKYKDSLLHVQNILDSKYHSAVVKMSSDKLTIQNKETKIKEKEKEKANQHLIYIFLISGILIASVVVYYYMYNSKKRKKKQNERLLAQSKIALIEKQKAEEALKKAQSQIDQFYLKISEHNQTISKLEDDLEKLKSIEQDEKQRVNTTLSTLKSAKILTDQDWIEFQQNFEIAFPELINSFKSYATEMTVSEIRHLMLAKLGFNNKEMARALGVSESAIRVTWSRVRKKLNLPSEETAISLVE
ncbi:MAG: hypothetical protein EOP00_25815, partial [Pedobacter sp.]